MASAGYDIAYSRTTDDAGTVVPNDQISARTDFGATDTFPTGINTVNLASSVLAQYVKLMVCSRGAMSVSARISSTTGSTYIGHGNIQTGWLIDGSLTGSTIPPTWNATPSGTTGGFSINSTLTTTYGPALDIITQPPQCGSQYINDSGVNAPVDLTVNVTGNLTGYWAAALLV